MTLHRLMGLNLFEESLPSLFGIRVRKFSLSAGRIPLETLESSTILHTSILNIPQKQWNNLTVKSSSPGEVPSFIWKNASSTSLRVMGFIKISFCSLVTREGNRRVIFSIFSHQSYLGSLRIFKKCRFKVASISSLVSTRSPLEFLNEKILF